jgi:ribosome-associated protein
LSKSTLLDSERILKELQFKAIRSGGPGGQHANKVSSKVELMFDITNSAGLSEVEKNRLKLKLSSKLTKDDILVLQCDETRSQHKNKELVIKRFFDLTKKALIVQKRRKKSKPTRSSIEKRLRSKKIASLKKKQRGKPDI